MTYTRFLLFYLESSCTSVANKQGDAFCKIFPTTLSLFGPRYINFPIYQSENELPLLKIILYLYKMQMYEFEIMSSLLSEKFFFAVTLNICTLIYSMDSPHPFIKISHYYILRKRFPSAYSDTPFYSTLKSKWMSQSNFS